MRFSDGDTNNQKGLNPWLAGAAGAGVGAAGYSALETLKSAKTRANWALAISLGLVGLSIINSSALQQDQANAQAGAIATNALTFTSSGTTGAEVAALRAQVTNAFNIMAKLAFDANIWNVFSTPPPVQTVSTSIAAITTVTTQAVSNNNILLLAVIGVGIAVVATQH